MFILTGRSIDGRVYAHGDEQSSAARGWSSDKRNATPLLYDKANQWLESRKARNRECDVDSIIGQLEIISKE